MVNVYLAMKFRQVRLGVASNGSGTVDEGNELAKGKGKVGS
jgi:hypothetical protein